MVKRTLDIHEDSWTEIAIVPVEDYELPISCRKISFREFERLVSPLFTPVDEVTCPLSSWIPEFDKRTFGFVQEAGCAFYGTRTDDSCLQVLCFTSIGGGRTPANVKYVDTVNGFFGREESDEMTFTAITDLLLTLGSRYQLVLVDDLSGNRRVVDLCKRNEVECYLKDEEDTSL